MNYTILKVNELLKLYNSLPMVMRKYIVRNSKSYMFWLCHFSTFYSKGVKVYYF